MSQNVTVPAPTSCLSLDFCVIVQVGGCGELMNLNVDCKFCTVHLWFASIPPLLLSVTMMVDAGRFRKYEPAQKGKNGFIEIPGVILVCMTLPLFFLYGLRVFWKRGYDREYMRMTAEMVEVKSRVLTDGMTGIAYYPSCIMMVMMAFEFIYTTVCVVEYDYSFHV